MTNPTSTSCLEPRFNKFLFAQVAEDRNGMALSVLSALARRDVDPWDEAAKLAALPGETAILRLATLIAPLPDGAAASLDAATIAARLVALLPAHADSEAFANAKGATLTRMSRWWPFMFVGLMLLFISAQMVMASRQPAERPAPVPPHAAVAVLKSVPQVDTVDKVSHP
jgi:hypothetical protein